MIQLIYGTILIILMSILEGRTAFTVSPARTFIAIHRHQKAIIMNPSNLYSSPGNNSPEPEQSKSKSKSKSNSNLPMLIDPGTKGGALFLSLILFVVPLILQFYLTVIQHMDSLVSGKFISFGFIIVAMGAWTGSYLIRVKNKDMTYAKQLKSYEDAVIEKRLSELGDDEVEKLLK